MAREDDEQTTGTSMFRAEAIEHRARGQRRGDVVRYEPRWTRSLFWMLLVTVLAAVVASAVVEIETEIDGITALDDQGRVVVLAPAALAPRVAPGDGVRLNGGAGEVVEIGEVLDPAAVELRYAVDVATASLEIITSVHDEAAIVDTTAAVVDSDPVAVALVPGLRALLGG